MPPNDLTLGFDTSAAHCAVALLSGGTVLAEVVEEMSKGQAERIMPLIEEVLASNGLVWKDISRIGVGVGPGNFTGIRISVSAARGLALGLGIPAIGVTSFEALSVELDGPIIASVDARGERVYVQEIGSDTTSEPQLMRVEDVQNQLSEFHRTFIGFQSDLFAEQLSGKSVAPLYPTAVAIAKIAAAAEPETIGRPTPLYVRPADAAPPRNQAPTIIP